MSDARRPGDPVSAHVRRTDRMRPRRVGGIVASVVALMLLAVAAPAAADTPAGQAITAVGRLVTHTNQPSARSEKLTVSPSASGNVLALAVETKFPSGTPTFTATNVSGGGVTTWSRAYAYQAQDRIHGLELWWGVVTRPGQGAITVTYSTGSTSGASESASSLDAQEFTSAAGASTTWSVDGTAKIDPGPSTRTPSYPSLAPSAGREAYFGFLIVPGSVGAGSSPGVVYQTDARGNQIAYAAAVSSTIAPAARSSASQVFSSTGMLLRAAGPSTTTTATAPPVTSAPVTSAPVTSAPATTIPPSTVPPTTAPVTTAPVTTVPASAAPSTTVRPSSTPPMSPPASATPSTTTPPASTATTSPVTTAPPTTAPSTTAPTTTTVPPPPAAATVTAVGQLYSHTNQGAQAQERISVTSRAVGDVLALAIETKYPGTPGFTAAGVTGGGVTTWTKALEFATSDGFHGQELWFGTVTSTGASTITVAFTSGSTRGTSESATSLDVQEFRSSSGAATTWTVDGTGTVDDGNPSSTPSYPTLSPTSPKEAYFGYNAVPDQIGAGSTPGVVYQTDARGNQIAYAVSVSAPITPKAKANPAQTFASAGMLLKAS